MNCKKPHTSFDIEPHHRLCCQHRASKNPAKLPPPAVTRPDITNIKFRDPEATSFKKHSTPPSSRARPLWFPAMQSKHLHHADRAHDQSPRRPPPPVDERLLRPPQKSHRQAPDLEASPKSKDAASQPLSRSLLYFQRSSRCQLTKSRCSVPAQDTIVQSFWNRKTLRCAATSSPD